MERIWTWIYILVPVKGSVREVWLRVGRHVERFGVQLARWQYFVGAGDEDIELRGDEVTWEAIFDWQDKHRGGRRFNADIDYEHGEWFEAKLVLLREPRFREDLDISILRGRSGVEWWSINLGFHEATMQLQGYEFCDRMITLGKELFIEFDGVFGVAGNEIAVVGMPDYSELYPHYYASVEFLKLLKEGVLREIPEREHPYESPIWFYLLNKEIYEASKEYIAKLPFKRVEKLSNGGALLFVDYPYTFEFFDKPRIHYID